MTTETKHAWTVNALLAVILALLGSHFIKYQSPVHAAGGGWETDGVVAGTTTDADRLVVVDTKKQNIMIYKSAQNRALRLVGARSYKYDVELEDTADTIVEKGQGRTFVEIYKAYNDKANSK